MTQSDSALVRWLREQIESWRPSIVGVFREDAQHDWPVVATSAEDLRTQLTTLGHLLPLPTEPASLANVMEIELSQHLMEAVEGLDGAEVRRGTQRSYPDLEFDGLAFGGGVRAVDIKCARRNKTGTGLQNRIALYTGNTYFLWPTLKFSGIARPFEEYRELLSVVVVYTFEPMLPERISDVEIVVHPTWRIASRSRASATREYIGSVSSIDALRRGGGEFGDADEFYEFWRSSSRKWRKSPEAERLLRRVIAKGRDEPPV